MNTLFRSLLKTMGLIRRAMEPFFAAKGLSGSQWGVLTVLHRMYLEGTQEVRLTDLSERLLIRPPSVSGVVDRLERNRLVERVASTNDHRSKPVRLTEAGRHIVEREMSRHNDYIRSILGVLSDDEQKVLTGMLERLCGHLESAISRTGLPASTAGENEPAPIGDEERV